MARTNIVIDDAIMAELLKITGMKTKREVVDQALRDLLQRTRQLEVRKYRGRLHWSDKDEDWLSPS